MLFSNGTAKQPQICSSVKENTKCSQPTRKSKKADYLQFTENRYKRMSNAEFVKAFEDDHEDEDDIKFTLIAKKTIPFFMANISREDREELQERFDVEDAYWQDLLDQYPDSIGKIPDSVRFHFFGLPVGDLSGLGVESYTVQKDFLVRELILFVVFLLFNLRKS